MPTPVTNLESLQEIEVAVSGPGSANRLFIVCGLATVNEAVNIFATAQGENKVVKETFSALVGPALTSEQFRRAVAIASPNGLDVNANLQGAYRLQWYLESVDAVFNDDSGKVELLFDMTVRAIAPPNGYIALMVSQVAFQVSILAAM